MCLLIFTQSTNIKKIKNKQNKQELDKEIFFFPQAKNK